MRYRRLVRPTTFTVGTGRDSPLSCSSPTVFDVDQLSTAAWARGLSRIWSAAAAELRREATMTAVPTMP